MIKGIKGVKDLLPEETPRWRLIEEKARFWASTFGFHEIRVPIFEGGRLQANLDAARAEQDIALAQYERAVQAAFRASRVVQLHRHRTGARHRMDPVRP